jgi:hypothetical protein
MAKSRTEKWYKKEIRHLIISLNKELIKSIALNRDQKKLLQNVLYIHNSVEKGLNLMIVTKLVQPIAVKPGDEGEDVFLMALKHVRIGDVVSRISFQRKLKVAKDFELLLSSEVKIFSRLNDLRNDFAHFRSKNIKDDLIYYHESYQLLLEARDLINILVAKILAEENMAVSPGEWPS